jgi:hypothetical protein
MHRYVTRNGATGSKEPEHSTCADTERESMHGTVRMMPALVFIGGGVDSRALIHFTVPLFQHTAGCLSDGLQVSRLTRCWSGASIIP